MSKDRTTLYDQPTVAVRVACSSPHPAVTEMGYVSGDGTIAVDAAPESFFGRAVVMADSFELFCGSMIHKTAAPM
jgi:hypothetical protein